MYEQFGFDRQEDGSYGFRLFVPDNDVDPAQYVRGGSCRIVEVRVVGDFQDKVEKGRRNWNYGDGLVMSERDHPNGRLFACTLPHDIPAGYYEYKYVVLRRPVPQRHRALDRRSLHQIWWRPAEQLGIYHRRAPLPKVTPLANRLPWQDLVIYELMIDDFTRGYRAGLTPIDAVAEKLDYLMGLGINAIGFMPWIAWPDEGPEEPFSWGYNPAYFFSVESRYVHLPGEPLYKLTRLRRLIDECHRRGVHVITDIVLQHAYAYSGSTEGGFPYHWLWQQTEDSPFIGKFTGHNLFGQPLDYHNLCTQQFASDVCRYWMDQFGIDGFRFDEVSDFYRKDMPTRGLPGLLTDVNNHLAAGGQRNFALILEDRWDFSSIHDTDVVNATNCWFDMMRARAFDYLRPGGRVDTRFLRVLNSAKDFAPSKGPVIYLENHDHSSITWVAGGRDRWYRVQPYLIALFTCPGAVMLRNGQEFGHRASFRGVFPRGTGQTRKSFGACRRPCRAVREGR
jgi:1,4-alpha-glucan branching enzyme